MSQDNSPAAPAADGPAFDNILNFRDVGETINAFLGQKYAAQNMTCALAPCPLLT